MIGSPRHAPAYLHHPSSLDHDTGAHPERAARIVAIERELERRDWCGFVPQLAPAVERAALEAVHSARHVTAIEALSAAGGGAIDADTLVSRGSWEAALHAAGGAMRLVDLLITGEAPTGFAALRPPGHHAEREQAMGFCLFDNVAVAARHARDAHGVERVLILDWDVHHGNGTNAIFHDTDEVLFVSIHQSPLYPGTGPASDVGSGRGTGFTVNLPVPPRTGDDAYVSLVGHLVAPLARAYEPQLVLVSAGYDAHRDDPLADGDLTEAGFAAMTRVLRSLCTELEAPLGAVLEGGYDLDALAASVAATLDALAAPPATDLELPPVHSLTAAAKQRLAAHWPSLAGTAGA